MTERMTDEYHFKGCWRDHHECAKEKLRVLAEEALAYAQVIADYGGYWDFFGNKMVELAREVLRDEHGLD